MGSVASVSLFGMPPSSGSKRVPLLLLLFSFFGSIEIQDFPICALADPSRTLDQSSSLKIEEEPHSSPPQIPSKIDLTPLSVVDAGVEIQRSRLIWTFQGRRLPPDLRDDFVDDDIRVDHVDNEHDAQIFQHAAMAVVRVKFNRNVSPRLHASVVSERKRANDTHARVVTAYDGVTRLVCGAHLIESIDFLNGSNSGKAEPVLRHTTKSARFHPEFSSAIDLLNRHVLPEAIFPKGPSQDYVAILPLARLCSSNLGYSSPTSSSSLTWEHCSLRFLQPSEQLRRDPHILVDDFGNQFIGEVKLSFRSSTGGHVIRELREHSRAATSSTPNASLLTSKVYRLLSAHRELLIAQLRLDRSQQRRQELTAHSSGSKHWDVAAREGGHYSRLRNPHSDPKLLNFIESSSDLKVGIIGIIGGLMNPVIHPVTHLMGSAVSDAVGPAVANLVLPAMVSGIADNIGETLSQPLTTAIIHDTVPGLTETVTDSVTQSLQHTIPKNVSTEITPVVTTRVTQSLTQPLTDQIVTWVQNFTSPKVAFHLNQHFGILASNTISIILVSALTETFTHNPLEDYFCYYCEKFQFYCAYCKVAPSRLYYTQYYTHFYSTYYTHYFVNYFAEPGFLDWLGFQYPKAEWAKVELQVPRPSGQGSPWQGYPQWGPQLL